MMRKESPLGLAPFEASDYLDNEEVIVQYLTVALADPDPNAFLAAVNDVAKARGIAGVSTQAGLGRESLYKALKPGAKPRFETVRRLLEALGVGLEVTAHEPAKPAVRENGARHQNAKRRSRGDAEN
jgi:probable addiction module antidote protein